MLKLLCEIHLQGNCAWGAAWTSNPMLPAALGSKTIYKGSGGIVWRGTSQSVISAAASFIFKESMRHTEKLLKRKHALLPSQVKQAEASVLQEFALNILLMYSEVISTPGMGCAEDAALTLGCVFLCTACRRKKRFLPRLYLLKVCFSCL